MAAVRNDAMPFTFQRLAIADVVLITPHIFEDERGFFIKFYNKAEFEKNGIHATFIEDSHSKSAHGVLRGLHFQNGKSSEAKFVRCTQGEILDVAVDLRKGSPTFGQHVTAVLSAANKQLLFIPRGFAHGFCVVSKEGAEVQYKIDNVYSPENEGGLLWNDPELKINWPIKNPIVSEKDAKRSRLKELKALPDA